MGSASNLAFIGTRKGLFTIIQNQTGGWKVDQLSFEGVQVPIVFFDDRDGHLYAALEHGHFGSKIHRSEDHGHAWTELPCPAYPEKPADVEDVDPFRKQPIPWAVKRIWALEGGGVDHPERLWCGTIPGGLFRSDDRGASWELNRPLWDEPSRKEWFGGGEDWPGLHSICVDPRDSNTIRVGISCGGVWETRDTGETWTCRADGMRAAYMPPDQAYHPVIQDPHRMVQCPGQPDIFWAQHHNGIFLSRDACASWQEIEEPAVSPFGFAVAVHPLDGKTAWFVPAQSDETRVPVNGRIVVTRTTDSGSTFEVQQDGLPQEDAYDIVFRHCLDVSPDGEQLIFGSTTGNLWTSSDGGRTWTAITAHLPPVYCVRFAK